MGRRNLNRAIIYSSQKTCEIYTIFDAARAMTFCCWKQVSSISELFTKTSTALAPNIKKAAPGYMGEIVQEADCADPPPNWSFIGCRVNASAPTEYCGHHLEWGHRDAPVLLFWMNGTVKKSHWHRSISISDALMRTRASSLPRPMHRAAPY